MTLTGDSRKRDFGAEETCASDSQEISDLISNRNATKKANLTKVRAKQISSNKLGKPLINSKVKVPRIGTKSPVR